MTGKSRKMKLQRERRLSWKYFIWCCFCLSASELTTGIFWMFWNGKLNVKTLRVVSFMVNNAPIYLSKYGSLVLEGHVDTGPILWFWKTYFPNILIKSFPTLVWCRQMNYCNSLYWTFEGMRQDNCRMCQSQTAGDEKEKIEKRVLTLSWSPIGQILQMLNSDWSISNLLGKKWGWEKQHLQFGH